MHFNSQRFVNRLTFAFQRKKNVLKHGGTGLHESLDREALFSRKTFFLWNAKVNVLTKRCELIVLNILLL